MEKRGASPFGLGALAAVYLFFLLLSASSYGDPFVFMGRIYTGRSAQFMVVADTVISLYLFIGILKKQLLTWRLLLGYNLLDMVNALVNLFVLSPTALEAITGAPVQRDTLKFNTLAAVLALVLLNVFIYRRRRLFVNRSPYLF